MRAERVRQELEDLPNLGNEVCGWLRAVGIGTPSALRRAGAVGATRRIRALRPADPPCRSMLSGLEGAIRGVRWHTIPKLEREALWRRYAGAAG